MGFDRINHIIPASLKKAGLETVVAVGSPLKAFERLANETLSDLPESSFHAVALTQGTLTVSCRSSRAAYRLRAVQDDILYAIRHSHPSAAITRVSVMLSTWR